MYYQRHLEQAVRQSLEHFAVVALVGPRQSGKSTLAKRIIQDYEASIYLDLERPSDREKLVDSELFLQAQKGKLICLDEIQRVPELFPLIRSLVDEWGAKGSFLILGSASRDLLRQSSESLAGRIAYHTLRPFVWSELSGVAEMPRYLLQGGFPNSILAPDPEISELWRENFISTFLERDIGYFTNASPDTLRRFWMMAAYANGDTANYSKFSKSLGTSDTTVRNYLELLSSTFMLDPIPAYHSNLGKRLVRAPKIYLTDTGITTSLLGIHTYEQLLGHPGYGALWEQVVLANIRAMIPKASVYHYRSSNGSEVDFVMELDGESYALECKASSSPKLGRDNHAAIADISPTRTLIVSPVDTGWPVAANIDIVSLNELQRLV